MDLNRLGDEASADEPPSKRQKLQNGSGYSYHEQRIVQCVDQELRRRVVGNKAPKEQYEALRERLEKQVIQNLTKSDLLSHDRRIFDDLLEGYVRREINNVADRERERLKAECLKTSQPGTLPAPVSVQQETAPSQARWPGVSESTLTLPARPNSGHYEGPSRLIKPQEAMPIEKDNQVERKLSPSMPIPSARPVSAVPPAAPSPAAPSQIPRAPPRPVEQHLGKPKREVPTSPTNFRARAHSSLWHGKQKEDDHQLSEYFTEKDRPYLAAETRLALSHIPSAFLRMDPVVLQNPVAVHFDFTSEEVACLRAAARQVVGAEPKGRRRDVEKDLVKQLARLKKKQKTMVDVAKIAKIPRRSVQDIEQYLEDILVMSKHAVQKPPTIPSIITVRRDPYDQHATFARSSKIPSLLFTREITGHRGHHGAMRDNVNFVNEFHKCRDDELELREEWTNCAGDISTIVWTSADNFICGTTEHSDAHNQQYNKPGNLVLGSCRVGTLRAYPDHRIVRPMVEKGENSTNAMRESQDPWLYTSVVSSDYDPNLGLAFTSGFDTTVKIWKVDETDSGPTMKVQGTWKHDGNVNFVVCSKHQSGMVATAADVPTNAIRIYKIRHDDIGQSPGRRYSCSRVTDEYGNTVSTEKWAYFPATMQWGQSPEVQHLLLVGYSPRSRTGDDNDIPQDRRDSGELCLWDGLTGQRWRITSATTQNVFEILWHPSQPSFIAATSPLGLDTDEGVRTQIRIFRVSDCSEYGGQAFTPVQTLDCTALDINELTIMPNSFTYCYISAACTDGKVYMWDTARGDRPIHVLRHDEPIDEYRGDREREDVGVKFTAWGNTPDRFYTGSSDGVVKVWNIRSHEKPLVRDLLEAPGPITCGLFSPDRSKLVVGDATGRVFLLSLDAPDDDAKKSAFTTLRLPNGTTKVVRPPKSIIYHKEPPTPEYNADGSLAEPEDSKAVVARANEYLANQQLMVHPANRHWVVQGPRYAELGFYRRDWHDKDDPDEPLLARWQMTQEDDNKRIRATGGRRRQQLLNIPVEDPLALEWHSLNNRASVSLLDVDTLPEETKKLLIQDGVDLVEVGEPDYMFNYEDYSEDEF
ncbi:Rik1-associated factor 1 [Rhypophila decipiens]|uniref:Rik1-associated factor 1 n=1 Tax=Rhypophila decipiens TaxID=261697 RepID=A0AAN6YDW0_9PEZI|nr:Rik1-associated factor 1 [Rhypophila decipiens]